MSGQSTQVFQASKPSRWKRFKWASRVLIFIGILGLIALYIAARNVDNPDVPLEQRVMKKFLTDNVPAYRESKLGKNYRSMRKFIQEQWVKGKGCGQKGNKLNLSNSHYFSDSLGIRAAFYVAWDAQSYISLKNNISKLNLVIPEWFFLDEKADTLKINIDEKALAFIKKERVAVMPMLTNNINTQWRGDVVHRIINDPIKKQRLIADIIRTLKRYDFIGINIDFEELIEERNEVLSNFQKELSAQLHANNLLLTQDVSPFNEDYNYSELSKSNDYLILMAYDEHHTETKPGPISSQQWIQAAVDNVTKHVPAQKIILAIAGYGYDWSKKEVKAVTYQEALTTARESEGNVKFDESTYNLSFEYYDGKDSLHTVYFTDAATNFNTLRYITEYGLAGSALWRLGSEDSRLWDFYDKQMTKDALKKFDFKEFDKVTAGNAVDYIGEGEVLDILSSPIDGHIKSTVDRDQMLIAGEVYDKLPSEYVIQKLGKNSGKKLVLTYDDGPDPVYTRQILDTLSKYHVPATFFVVGLEAENNIPLIKRIYNEGHEIGNHTFTHPNMANVSKSRANVEMDLTRMLIECITGHSTVMFRAPFNADSEPGSTEELIPVALSRKKNYLTIGESIDPEDWEKGLRSDFNADTIFNRVVNIYNYRVKYLEDSASIILLHDAGGDRSETVNATGKIIRYFQSRGYTFTTVADLMHKKRDELMPPVPKGSGYYLLQFNYFLLYIGYLGSHFFETLFILFMIGGAIRLSMLALLVIKNKRTKRETIFKLPAQFPLVSIIVPAYNEEVNAVSSITSLLNCDYPNFNIVFVNDGSTDDTFTKVQAVFSGHPKLMLLNKENGGKAAALNYGLNFTNADYVVCIDADTKLRPDAVRLLMNHFFTNKNVGAVAGNVKVGNQVNFLTKFQSIEYVTGQNFDRRAFAAVNAVTVVPGAIGAFKKQAIEDAGGFTTDTLAEDCDLTIRIVKAGYIIEEENKAIAITEVPETVAQFMKQRFRWTFGVLQAVWKNKDQVFSTKNKGLGWLALPDIILFKYIVPFFAPLADVFMLISLLGESRNKVLIYYLIFTVVDALIASVAFTFEKESFRKLIWLIPQRLIYRWLLMAVLFKALRRAIKGELQNWGVLKRTGNVKEETVLLQPIES